ncbi:MAG: glycosyltransferase [Promethearchaeota archaeon]
MSIYLVGQTNINWSVDKDFKHAKHFLEKNNFKFEGILKASHIFFVYHNLLFKREYSWIGFFKKLLNFKLISTITNPFITERERFKEWTDSNFNPHTVKKIMKLVDLWIAPSKRIYNFLENHGYNVILIPFYVSNKEFFHINKSKEDLCKELNIDYNKVKNKVVIGSFQRDTLSNLEVPKWDKDPDLLINILRSILNDNFILLIAGPRRHYIVNECKKFKIPFLYYGDYSFIEEKKDDLLVNNHSAQKINLLNNLSDIIILSSPLEGGPKGILEASLTKTLIFSRDVGFAPDFIHKDLIYSNNDYKKVSNSIINFNNNQEKIDEYIKYNYNQVQSVMNEENYKKLYKKLIYLS